ncbi:MAG TPA: polysaccharide deacetylase family protein [Gammaproteobacteria bacterium]
MKRLLVAFLLIFALPAESAVVFMYHRFGESHHPSTNVTLEQFEAHLDFLEREGFEVWPLPKLVTHLKQREPISDKVAVITVDDAYRSVYEHAFPMLKARNMPFTVFVATAPVDRNLPDYMRWDQLRELHAAGVTLANHGVSHGYLIRREPGESEPEWERRVRDDIVQGQLRLQEELGKNVNESPRLFAYPFGEYDVALMTLLEQMGYAAFGQHSGALGPHDDLRALPRFPINERYAAIPGFSVKALSLPFPVRNASPRDPVVAGDAAPELILELDESSANLAQLTCYFGGERMDVTWLNRETRRLSVATKRNLPAGRSRYNCTAPHESTNRWYWYSHLWIR